MARRAHPWWSEDRSGGGWFVTVDGIRHKLGDHPEGAATPFKRSGRWNVPNAILEEFHKLMAKRQPGRTGDYRFADVVALYLEENPDREADYSKPMLSLCRFKAGKKLVGDLMVNAELEASHLKAWLDAPYTHKDGQPVFYAPASKATFAQMAKAVLNWAKRKKAININANPFDELSLDAVDPRDVVLSKEEHEAHKAFWTEREKKPRVGKSDFCDLLDALWYTGARPGELYGLEAKDVDFKQDVAFIKQHKTKKKVGGARRIGIADELKPILVKLVAKYPEGPLFRGSLGQAWNTSAVFARFETARAEKAIRDEVTAYAYRHSYATYLLSHGADVYDVAKLLGHQSVATTIRQYDKSRQNSAHIAKLAKAAGKIMST